MHERLSSSILTRCTYVHYHHSCRSVGELIRDDDDAENNQASFWAEVKFAIAVMKPIYTLLRATDTSKPMMGKFYYLMHQAGEQLKTVFEQQQFSQSPFIERQDAIVDIHMGRWIYMHTDYHSAGYALDPNFLTHDVNGINDGEVFAGLKTVVKRFYHDNQADFNSALQQYTDFREQRGAFSDKSLMSLVSTMPAHEWWDMVGGSVSKLRYVAMHVLSKTTSASACERNWSAFAAVQTPKRNRLRAKVLHSLVFVRSNLRLQQVRSDPAYKQALQQWLEDAVDKAAYIDEAASDEGSDSDGSEVHSDVDDDEMHA